MDVPPLFLILEFMPVTEPLKVYITKKAVICAECAEDLGKKAWVTWDGEDKNLCLSCADLDYLVYLPSGDAALTRRSTKHSGLTAVVLDLSKRKRYARQGILVEARALMQAEEECLADADLRARRQEREAVKRAVLDQEYIVQFAGRIRELFPAAPAGREQEIAEHACEKYSGRVGRSARAKEFQDKALSSSVVAHIRHRETKYDEYLAAGMERDLAREKIAKGVARVLAKWRA